MARQGWPDCCRRRWTSGRRLRAVKLIDDISRPIAEVPALAGLAGSRWCAAKGFTVAKDRKLGGSGGGSLGYPSVFPLSLFPAFSAAASVCPPFGTEREAQAIPASPGLTPTTESPFDLSTARRKEERPANSEATHSRPETRPQPAAAANPDQPLDLSLGGRSRTRPKGEEPKRSGHMYGGEERSEMAAPKADSSLQHARPTPFFMDPIYSRVEKRKVNDPFETLKDKYMRPAPGFLFHPQFRMPDQRTWMSAIENMAEKLESFGSLKPDAGDIMRSVPSMFDFRAPPATLPESLLRKGKERYTCRYCGKIFPRSANLTRHLRTHTGEQPYRCKYCDKLVSASSTCLHPHKDIYNKEKPLRIATCVTAVTLNKPDRTSRSTRTATCQPPSVRLDSSSAILEDKEDSYFNEIRNFISNSGQRQTSPPHSEEGINGGHFEEDKGPTPSRESRDLEEVEEPGAEEEAGEQSEVTGKPADDALPSNLEDDNDATMRDEMDFEGTNDLELNCKTSPRRFEDEEEEEEEQGSFSALDHIRHFSDMRKMDDREFGDGDVTGFGSSRLSEAVKQPLYRKSKSQAYAMMLSLADKDPLHAGAHGPSAMWHSLARAAAESSAIQSLSHV
ncbi:hypothetical protein AALO_G00199640 [Alosa alosa]|uniref:C2H2-type domain-containing protein n=1 Tax=Alosa alosa TaxID=278164 RepID=A0AAV6G266_9TELE|nr:hypothetical protein AALO_G00199640 [Alosa alosa]